MLKQKRHKDEKHRRFIASFPCINCGIEGSTQAAHVTLRMHSKMGAKTCDYNCIPLCHEGANNCHKRFDSYEILDNQREALRALGLRIFQVTGDEQKALERIEEWRASAH